MEKGSSLVSVVSHPGIIPRYTREGGDGPLGGEMEHEAREARPIGAQGAFASNSMHYTYTPALFAAPSIPRIHIRRWLTEKHSPRNAHRSASFDVRRFLPISRYASQSSESDPRNLSPIGW